MIRPYTNPSHSLLETSLHPKLSSSKLPRNLLTLTMAKNQNQPQVVQAVLDFKINPPSTSSKEGSPIQITRPAPLPFTLPKLR